jgi:hypothetical protein
MTEPVQARKFDWQPEYGLLIVTGANGEHPLSFPIAGLPPLGIQARR